MKCPGKICHNGPGKFDELDRTGGSAVQALDCGREVAANAAEGAVVAAGTAGEVDDGALACSSFHWYFRLEYYDTQ